MLTYTPLSIWTMQTPSTMTTLTSSVKYFAGGTNASKPDSSYTTKTMRHMHWFFYGKWDTGNILVHFKTVQWQYGDSPSTDSDMRSVYSKIYLSVCLFVCLWVCLSVYYKGILPLASDLYRICHCLGLKHTFSDRDVRKSKQSKLVNTKKICGGDFGPPW